MANKTVWHTGTPPSVGWWIASCMRNESALRWWNGRHWSRAAFHHYSPERAAAQANIRALSNLEIEWADRPSHWPKRSMT